MTYLKVLLSPQIVIGGLGLVFLLMFREDIKELLLRVAKIKFPGGTEVSTSQSERQSNEENLEQKPPPTPETPITGLPADLPPAQRLAVENILKAERATSYLWEYRYLNYFLVYSTQTVLNWLISLS